MPRLLGMPLIFLYIILYWIFGSCFFLWVFGYDFAIELLCASPFSQWSGAVILLSSGMASFILLNRRKNKLAAMTFSSYLRLGFYIGNLSLLLMFLIDHLLYLVRHWKFPEALLIFIAPWIELFFSYLMIPLIVGALLALIPACCSVLVLYGLVRLRSSVLKLS